MIAVEQRRVLVQFPWRDVEGATECTRKARRTIEPNPEAMSCTSICGKCTSSSADIRSLRLRISGTDRNLTGSKTQTNRPGRDDHAREPALSTYRFAQKHPPDEYREHYAGLAQRRYRAHRARLQRPDHDAIRGDRDQPADER